MADGGEGAAYFDESDGRAHYVRTQGDGDINRAELLGILKAIQDHRDTITTIRIFTDSAVSLKWIRRWVFNSHEVTDLDPVHILYSVERAIRERAAATELYKVPAHVGIHM